MTDKLSKKQRSYNMSRIKGKNTNPELILKKLLKKRQIKQKTKAQKKIKLKISQLKLKKRKKLKNEIARN